MRKFIFPLVVVILLAAGLVSYSYLSRPGAPVQPIAFSHRIHAGVNQIPCAFCHRFASQARVAGMPTVESCKNCHMIIAPQSEEVQKVMTYWSQQRPLAWTKVYDLPDHVYFSHKRHVKVGLGCQACHGDVAKMDKIYPVVDLKMGWCLDCHRKEKASLDCWTCHT